MKKRLLTFVMTVAVLAGLMSGLPANAAVTKFENETAVYQYLKENLGLNTAAACGVLANLEAESGFRPDVGSSYYGIVQWGGGRLSSLKSFCSGRGYSYSSLDGQLAFIQNELENGYKSVYDYLKTVPNTAQGAYDAAYKWASSYEVCAQCYREPRAVKARDSYWPVYGKACEHQWELQSCQLEHPHYSDEKCILCGEMRTNLESGNYMDQCLLCNPMGDVNNDHELTLQDAALLFGHVNGVQLLPTAYRSRGDLTGEGKLTMADVYILYRMVAGY